ncbi:hypothetical protein D3C72_1464540 [compost metagenome]
MGTPLVLDKAKLRAKRAIVPFRMILPAIGRRSLARSHLYKPSFVRSQARQPKKPPTPSISRMGQYVTVKRDVPIRMRVISGSSAWKLANTFSNWGMTKIFTTIMAASMAKTTKVG